MVEESQTRRAVAENPRTSRVRKIVLDAATTILLEQGHQAVTPQAVSKATRVARSTIYRLWPDRVSLLLETIDTLLAPHHSVPAVGELTADFQADLTITLESLRRRLSTRPFRAIFAALLDHANSCGALIPAQRRFVSGVEAPLREIILAAGERGLLDRSIKLEEAAAQLTGPLFHQHVMLRARITDELIARTVEGFLATNHVRTDSPAV